MYQEETFSIYNRNKFEGVRGVIYAEMDANDN